MEQREDHRVAESHLIPPSEVDAQRHRRVQVRAGRAAERERQLRDGRAVAKVSYGFRLHPEPVHKCNEVGAQQFGCALAPENSSVNFLDRFESGRFPLVLHAQVAEKPIGCQKNSRKKVCNKCPFRPSSSR